MVVYTEDVQGVSLALEEQAIAVFPRENARGGTDTQRLAGSWKKPVVLLCAVVLVTSTALIAFRYRSAADKSLPPQIKSIAVLPLKNLSDPANEYFSEGMTDSLINALSKVRDLKVISRASLMRFQGKDADPREIGKQLGVMSVLEGSVRKSGESVRVAVRLVSVEDGHVLWAIDTNERALGDVFALQDEIASNVVAGLKVNLTGEGAQRFGRRYTESIEAYQLYLKGRYFWNKRTAESLQKSIDYFEQALKTDPRYTLAYVGLADSYLVLKSLSLITPQEAHLKVEAALNSALQIDDTLGEAHKSLAWLRFSYDWNWSGAEQEFRRAIELEPNDATTHQWYAEYLSAMGRLEESLAEIGRAQQLEPPSPIINVIAAQTYFFGRRYDQAIDQCRKTLELDPNFYIAHDYLAWSLEKKGLYDEAIAAIKKARQLEDTPLQLYELGNAFAIAGKKAEALNVLRVVAENSKRDHAAPQHFYRRARIYSAMADLDSAFARLDQAFEAREENLVWLRVDPHLDNLRSDPRFTRLVQRMKFSP